MLLSNLKIMQKQNQGNPHNQLNPEQDNLRTSL